jgi:hypothetical protein
MARFPAGRKRAPNASLSVLGHREPVSGSDGMRMRWTTGGLVLALAACGSGAKPDGDLAQLDRELAQVNATSPAGDPALRSALKDQIMVDPALTRMANADAVRPPPQPLGGATPPDEPASGKPAERDALRSAPPPGDCRQCAAARQAMTLGALAGSQGGRAGQCAAAIAYSATWANRLPKGVPLYPDAHVTEAAGADGAGCALRVVSFTSGAPMQRLLDYYYTRTTAAGFAAQHGADGGEHTLAGTKAGGAFLVTLKPAANGGTAVDLMADGG